MKATVSLV